jgi:hypothetical protein
MGFLQCDARDPASADHSTATVEAKQHRKADRRAFRISGRPPFAGRPAGIFHIPGAAEFRPPRLLVRSGIRTCS